MAIAVTLLDPTSEQEMPGTYIRVQVDLSLTRNDTRVVCTIVDSDSLELFNEDAVDKGDGVWEADISAVEFDDGYYTVTAVGTAGEETDDDIATCVYYGEPPNPCPDAKANSPKA